jgi:hypothetical protein
MKVLTFTQKDELQSQIEELILQGASPEDDRVKALERLMAPNYIQFEGCRDFIPVGGGLTIGDEYANEDEDESGSVIYKICKIGYSDECNGHVGYCTFSYSLEDTEIEADTNFGAEED